jgi:hypothetical protein
MSGSPPLMFTSSPPHLQRDKVDPDHKLNDETRVDKSAPETYTTIMINMSNIPLFCCPARSSLPGPGTLAPPLR